MPNWLKPHLLTNFLSIDRIRLLHLLAHLLLFEWIGVWLAKLLLFDEIWLLWLAHLLSIGVLLKLGKLQFFIGIGMLNLIAHFLPIYISGLLWLAHLLSINRTRMLLWLKTLKILTVVNVVYWHGKLLRIFLVLLSKHLLIVRRFSLSLAFNLPHHQLQVFCNISPVNVSVFICLNYLKNLCN